MVLSGKRLDEYRLGTSHSQSRSEESQRERSRSKPRERQRGEGHWHSLGKRYDWSESWGGNRQVGEERSHWMNYSGSLTSRSRTPARRSQDDAFSRSKSRNGLEDSVAGLEATSQDSGRWNELCPTYNYTCKACAEPMTCLQVSRDFTEKQAIHIEQLKFEAKRKESKIVKLKQDNVTNEALVKEKMQQIVKEKDHELKDQTKQIEVFKEKMQQIVEEKDQELKDQAKQIKVLKEKMRQIGIEKDQESKDQAKQIEVLNKKNTDLSMTIENKKNDVVTKYSEIQQVLMSEKVKAMMKQINNLKNYNMLKNDQIKLMDKEIMFMKFDRPDLGVHESLAEIKVAEEEDDPRTAGSIWLVDQRKFLISSQELHFNGGGDDTSKAVAVQRDPIESVAEEEDVDEEYTESVLMKEKSGTEDYTTEEVKRTEKPEEEVPGATNTPSRST